MRVLGLVNSFILLERDANLRFCSTDNVKPLEGFEKKRDRVLCFQWISFNRRKSVKKTTLRNSLRDHYDSLDEHQQRPDLRNTQEKINGRNNFQGRIKKTWQTFGYANREA